MNQFYSVQPFEIKEELAHLSFNWWVCGGWALELYAGKKIREHHDMDLAVFRKDQFKLKKELPEWEFQIAVDGKLYPWGEGEIDSSLHALWARKKGQDKWMTEFLLNESDDENWIFRKNKSITYPLDKMGMLINTIPVLHPAIPLLFKSAHCNEKDTLDLLAVLGKLDSESKRLLKDWIRVFQPECNWLEDHESLF
ncbi:MAG: nucleotidyltransferase domain-containing protein [Bacteroidia bacterium]